MRRCGRLAERMRTTTTARPLHPQWPRSRYWISAGTGDTGKGTSKSRHRVLYSATVTFAPTYTSTRTRTDRLWGNDHAAWRAQTGSALDAQKPRPRCFGTRAHLKGKQGHPLPTAPRSSVVVTTAGRVLSGDLLASLILCQGESVSRGGFCLELFYYNACALLSIRV